MSKRPNRAAIERCAADLVPGQGRPWHDEQHPPLDSWTPDEPSMVTS